MLQLDGWIFQISSTDEFLDLIGKRIQFSADGRFSSMSMMQIVLYKVKKRIIFARFLSEGKIGRTKLAFCLDILVSYSIILPIFFWREVASTSNHKYRLKYFLQLLLVFKNHSQMEFVHHFENNIGVAWTVELYYTMLISLYWLLLLALLYWHSDQFIFLIYEYK